MKRLAIFASYSANGRVADYVFFYLRALRRFADIILPLIASWRRASWRG